MTNRRNNFESLPTPDRRLPYALRDKPGPFTIAEIRAAEAAEQAEADDLIAGGGYYDSYFD